MIAKQHGRGEASAGRRYTAARRWRRALLYMILVGILVLVWLRADAYLVAIQPLQQADAIVILLGGLPYRAMAAGEIYRAGYARRIVVSHPAIEDPRLVLFRRFGLPGLEDDEAAAKILAAYGVPRAAILVSVTEPLGTGPEMRGVARLLRRERFRSVILVTDPLHTRRAALYLRAQADDNLRIIPRPSEPRQRGVWWSNPKEAEAVLHEYGGLLVFGYRWLSGGLTPDSGT